MKWLNIAKLDYKILTIISWGLCSSAFLWMFSLSINSNPQGAAELFESYIIFTYMLFGGGGCYHFLISLSETGYDQEIKSLWIPIMVRMSGLALLMVSAPSSVFFFKHFLEDGNYQLASVLYISAVFIGFFIFGNKIEKKFKELRKKIATHEANGYLG